MAVIVVALMYETPHKALSAARERGIPPGRFRQVRPSRWTAILDRVLKVFTPRGVLNRNRDWLWEDFAQPCHVLRRPHTPATLLELDVASCRVWLILEDFDCTKRAGRHWLFEGDLGAVVEVLNNMHFMEFYVVARDLEWMVAENHHDMLFGVGEHGAQMLRALEREKPAVPRRSRKLKNSPTK